MLTREDLPPSARVVYDAAMAEAVKVYPPGDPRFKDNLGLLELSRVVFAQGYVYGVTRDY